MTSVIRAGKYSRNMPKDFDNWNEQKKNIHARKADVMFHEREVWWCSLGVNVGFEQDGGEKFFERPVLVIKKFNRDVLWVLPLTRSQKRNLYYVPVTVGDENSAVILSQLRLISSKRLQRYMHKLPQGQFREILRLLQQFFPRT